MMCIKEWPNRKEQGRQVETVPNTSLWKLIKKKCIAEEAVDRPKMKKVVNELEELIKDIFPGYVG